MAEQDSPFVARITLSMNRTPMRAYVHRAGFEEVYESSPLLARDHLSQILDKNPMRFSHYDFLIALIWGKIIVRDQIEKRPVKNIDFVGYNFELAYADETPVILGQLIEDTKLWPGNPEVEPFFYQNGVLVPKRTIPSNGKFCGDGLILFGMEEIYRRFCTKDLEDFVNHPPNLGDFEPNNLVN